MTNSGKIVCCNNLEFFLQDLQNINPQNIFTVWGNNLYVLEGLQRDIKNKLYNLIIPRELNFLEIEINDKNEIIII